MIGKFTARASEHATLQASRRPSRRSRNAYNTHAAKETAEYKAPPALPGIDARNLCEDSVRNYPAASQAAALSAAVDCWHQQAVLAHLSDYSRATPDNETMEAPEVDGPAYTSRALAIIHLAMWDAYVGLSRDANTYLAYSELPDIVKEERWVAIVAAVARAATDTTQALFKQTAGALENIVAGTDVAALFESPYPAAVKGVEWGTKVAAAVLADRSNDGSEDGMVFTPVPPTDEAYRHREDPQDAIDPDALLGNYAAHWGNVRGFGFDDLTANAFVHLPTPLPPKTTLDYPEDYKEVKREGVRRDEDTKNDENLETGIFWAYDGSYRIGLPNRLYNDAIDAAMAAVDAAKPPPPFTRLRVYATANVAMADAGIAAWCQKYFHLFWRPTIGIRCDPELPTQADWLPFGAPQTNTSFAKRATNPMFPAYPSGHATFGTAAFVVLRNELGLPDTFTYEFTSAEFDGVARAPGGERKGEGVPRPCVKRRLTIQDSIQQNLDARVYIGVHWRFDSEQGDALGRAIGDAVSANFPAKAPTQP